MLGYQASIRNFFISNMSLESSLSSNPMLQEFSYSKLSQQSSKGIRNFFPPESAVILGYKKV